MHSVNGKEQLRYSAKILLLYSKKKKQVLIWNDTESKIKDIK